MPNNWWDNAVIANEQPYGGGGGGGGGYRNRYNRGSGNGPSFGPNPYGNQPAQKPFNTAYGNSTPKPFANAYGNQSVGPKAAYGNANQAYNPSQNLGPGMESQTPANSAYGQKPADTGPFDAAYAGYGPLAYGNNPGSPNNQGGAYNTPPPGQSPASWGNPWDNPNFLQTMLMMSGPPPSAGGKGGGGGGKGGGYGGGGKGGGGK